MKAVVHQQQSINEKILFFFSKIWAFILFIKPYFTNFFMFIFTFLSPVFPIVVTTILVIGLDTVMGIWKAKYLFNTKQVETKPNSNNFKRGFVPKAILYTALIIIGFILDRIMLNDIVSHLTKISFSINSNFISTKLLALILISIEAKSIDENFIVIFGVSIRKKLIEFIKKIKQPLINLLDNDKK